MNNFSIVEIVRKTFKAYKNNYPILMLAVAIYSGVWTLAPLIDPLSYVSIGSSSDELLQKGTNPQDFVKKIETIKSGIEEQTNSRMLVSWIIWILLYLVSLFLQLGLVKMCLEAVNKGKTKLSVLFSQKDTFGSVVLAAFLLAIGLLGTFFAIALPIGFFADTFSLDSMTTAVVGLIGCALILLIFVPFFFVRWSIVDKKITAIEGLLYSWKLVKSQFKKVLLFFILFIPLMSFCIKFLEGLFTPILKFIPIIGVARFALPYYCASILTIPLVMLTMACVYSNLISEN